MPLAYNVERVSISKRSYLYVIQGSDRHLVSIVAELFRTGYRDIKGPLIEIHYKERLSEFPMSQHIPESQFFMGIVLIDPFEDNGYSRHHADIYVSERLRGAGDFILKGGLAHELGHMVRREQAKKSGISPKEERLVDREVIRRGFGDSLLAYRRFQRGLGADFSFRGYTPEELDRLLI